jgi:hypothetical protein
MNHFSLFVVRYGLPTRFTKLPNFAISVYGPRFIQFHLRQNVSSNFGVRTCLQYESAIPRPTSVGCLTKYGG